MPSAPCPFCTPDAARIAYEAALVRVIWDAFPLSDGHALVLPRRHIASLFEATEAERAALMEGVTAAREQILLRSSPDAFNIGINDGAAAGQTVPHLHIHVIPRTHGDVKDPRGGVRWVLPERAAYWAPPSE